jgi:hypothetical protein
MESSSPLFARVLRVFIVLLSLGAVSEGQHGPFVPPAHRGNAAFAADLNSNGELKFAAQDQSPNPVPHDATMRVRDFGNAALDPVLSYSTYLAGQQTNEASAVVAVDGEGNACALIQGFLTKLRSNGSVIYTATYGLGFGGIAEAVAIDSGGNCYVSNVGDITTTPGAFQSTGKAGQFGSQFVIKFSPTGSVVYATYLGGSGSDTPTGLAVDSTGNAYLTGLTSSNDFPVLNAFQSVFGGGSYDAFVAVLNSTGSALVYSTYLGGSGTDQGSAIAVDGASNAYVTGTTTSSNFPTVAAFQSKGTGNDAFVTKLDSAGTPIYSTYLGGSVPNSTGNGIASDSAGDAYVTGQASSGFPLVNPIQSTGSAFVCKFNPAGSALVYSTYFGGTLPSSIAVDSSSQAYITGGIASPGGLPTVSPVMPQTDGFLSVFSSGGTSIVFSTYLGSQPPPLPEFEDQISAVAVDSAGNMYVAGITNGPFPILNPENGTYNPFKACNFCFTSQAFTLKIAPTAGTVLASPGAVPFPSTAAGSSSQTAQLLLANASSSGTVNISSIVIAGDFSQTNDCPAALDAAANCAVTVTFTPTAGGVRNGTVTVTDDAPGSPQVINLSGIGLVPTVSLAPSALTFPSQMVGTTSSPEIVTLSNKGGAGLSITQISISGDFAETNNCGLSVAAGSYCQISVTFTPTAIGIRNGTLSVTDNASGSPQAVPLSGTGGSADFTFTPASGQSTSATVSAGQNAMFNLNVTPEGSFSGTVTLACTIAPAVTPAPTCTVPSSVSVKAGAVSPVQATVSTTAAMTTGTLSNPGLQPGAMPFEWSAMLLVPGLVLLRNRRRLQALATSSAVLSMILLFVGCGGGGSGSSHSTLGTPSGTYTVKVTATSGSLQQSTTLTVVVQ